MKSKLRHPIRAIREPFGTAGLIVACVALVAALGGSAIAAAGLTGKQKKQVTSISKKIAKKFATAGPQGLPGAPGAQGLPGAPGSNGKDGADGISPVGTSFAGEKGGCTEGGVEFEGANTTFACNGVKGQDGQTGFTDTLPVGKTETGAWGAFNPTAGGSSSLISMSFNIPLPDEAPLTVNYINMAGEAKTVKTFPSGNEPAPDPNNCPGTAETPEAAPGHLCIYTSLEQASAQNVSRVQKSEEGVLILFTLNANGLAFGNWAVTAASPAP